MRKEKLTMENIKKDLSEIISCELSIAGDEFYYVVLQKEADVAYVYPCKYFELDSSHEA